MGSRIRQMPIVARFSPARTCLALASCVTVMACNGTTEPMRLVSISPTTSVIALQNTPGGKTLNTSVTLTNTSAHEITFDFCAMTLEKRIDGPVAVTAGGPRPPWFTVWSPVCALASAESSSFGARSVQPGESVTIPVSIPVGQTGASVFDGAPGVYRVYLSLVTKIVGEFRSIPHDLSVSDPFTVVVQ